MSLNDSLIMILFKEPDKLNNLKQCTYQNSVLSRSVKMGAVLIGME